MFSFIDRGEEFFIIYEREGSNIKLMTREAFKRDFGNGKYKYNNYIIDGEHNESDARRRYIILWNSRNEVNNYIYDENNISLIR